MLASPRSPLAPSGFSVPTEQRRGRDQERMPTFPRKNAAERGQEGAVDRSVPDAMVKLVLEHPDLVTEDQKLDVLVRPTAPEREYERQNPAEPFDNLERQLVRPVQQRAY